jgi:predicted  nucleic acid-binding Zn-ribbon protein
MLFIAEKVGSWDELTEWARTTPEEIQAAMAAVESKACKAEESQREHSERIKAVEDRRNNYVAEFQKCQDRKRIASLKRKIARAEARLEVLRSIDSLFQKPEEK